MSSDLAWNARSGILDADNVYDNRRLIKVTPFAEIQWNDQLVTIK